MFCKLLPQLLCPADVAPLAVFVAATEENDDFLTVQSIINAKSRPKRNSQFKHAAAHGFAIAEISGAHAGQTRIHRCLYSQVAKGIKPLVKRDESILKLQLLDFLLKHF